MTTDHNASYYTFTLERFTIDGTQTGPIVKVNIATVSDDFVKDLVKLIEAHLRAPSAQQLK